MAGREGNLGNGKPFGIQNGLVTLPVLENELANGVGILQLDLTRFPHRLLLRH